MLWERNSGEHIWHGWCVLLGGLGWWEWWDFQEAGAVRIQWGENSIYEICWSQQGRGRVWARQTGRRWVREVTKGQTLHSLGVIGRNLDFILRAVGNGWWILNMGVTWSMLRLCKKKYFWHMYWVDNKYLYSNNQVYTAMLKGKIMRLYSLTNAFVLRNLQYRKKWLYVLLQNTIMRYYPCLE